MTATTGSCGKLKLNLKVLRECNNCNSVSSSGLRADRTTCTGADEDQFQFGFGGSSS